MRLIDYFPESSISIKNSAKNWQEAIDFSMSSLLANHYVNSDYIQAIKDSTINNGPYYIFSARRRHAARSTGVWRVKNRYVINASQTGSEICRR